MPVVLRSMMRVCLMLEPTMLTPRWNNDSLAISPRVIFADTSSQRLVDGLSDLEMNSDGHGGSLR